MRALMSAVNWMNGCVSGSHVNNSVMIRKCLTAIIHLWRFRISRPITHKLTQKIWTTEFCIRNSRRTMMVSISMTKCLALVQYWHPLLCMLSEPITSALPTLNSWNDIIQTRLQYLVWFSIDIVKTTVLSRGITT